MPVLYEEISGIWDTIWSVTRYDPRERLGRVILFWNQDMVGIAGVQIVEHGGSCGLGGAGGCEDEESSW